MNNFIQSKYFPLICVLVGLTVMVLSINHLVMILDDVDSSTQYNIIYYPENQEPQIFKAKSIDRYPSYICFKDMNGSKHWLYGSMQIDKIKNTGDKDENGN